MKFEYLLIADGVNLGPEATVNALGLGWRQVTFSQLPAPLTFAIVANVTVPRSEAGEYPSEFWIELPSGARELIRSGPAVFERGPDDVLATSLVMVMGVARTFTEPGDYRIKGTVGGLSAEYAFRVRVEQPALLPAPTPAPVRSRRARPTKSPVVDSAT